MRTSIVLVIAAASASSLAANPADLSQHPRAGELCEIHFMPGADLVPIGVTPELDAIAGWAVQHPAGYVVLDSHADSATAADNQLALRRANRVRDSLAQAHVDRDQVIVALYGPGPRAGSLVVWGTDDSTRAITDFTAANGGVVMSPL